MRNRKLRFWFLYHIGLLIFSAAASLLMNHTQTGNALSQTVIVTFSTIFMTATGIGYLLLFMINRAKKFNQAQINKMILPALLIFYILASLIASLSITIGVFSWFIYIDRDLSEFWPHLYKNGLNFGNGSFFIWLLFFTLAFFYVLWQKSAKKEQSLREENLKYKYQNLKAQVNPHFLFNSLNTLSEIVYEDAKKAENYIQKLSRIYRYILDNEETDLIRLNEEIEFLQYYIDLQKVRDNGKIRLDINVMDTDKYNIIPVSLQVLVENALKHNSRSEESPLIIQIKQMDNHLVVSNTIQRKNILGNTSKTGLKNLQERVKLILGRELVIQEEDNQFIVKLPFIPVEK